MCGITGFFNPLGIDNNLELINKMTDSLTHRGPDSRGIYIDNICAFGHRRLSIIDLATGHQPMWDNEKSVCTIFNGEIYNFLEIRKELEELGIKFNTKSDTEVIIYSYKYWGEEFIEKLNGMFSIAIYDKKKKSLYLYRDRLGIKPLYYTFYNNNIVFSSEPKALFFFGIEKKINLKALSHYLTSHNFNLNEETLFENIFLLEKSTFIKFNKNGLKKKKYWSLDFQENIKDENFYINELKDKLEYSTKIRLISDVELGSFLSGGVDSSILVSIIKNNLPKNLKTFSIGFKEEDFNEFEYSDIVKELFNIEHYKIIFNENDYFNLNEELIKFKDFPLNVPNEVLIYQLSKKLKEQITVVLSGEGADELFGGYGLILRAAHDYAKIFLLNRCPDFFNKDVNDFIKKKLLNYYKKINFNSIYEFLYEIYSIFNLNEKKYLFQENYFKNIENDNFIKINFKKIFNECEKESYYDKILYFLNFYHLEGLLLRLDNATMAASVESRVPFVDYKLVEFGFNIPFEYKVKWKSNENISDAIISTANEICEHFDITKYILRKSFKDKLPEKILNRNKFSFPVPLNDWFNKKFKNYLINKFKYKNSYFYEYFNYDNVNEWINNVSYGKNGLKIWMLLNLKLWFDKNF